MRKICFLLLIMLPVFCFAQLNMNYGNLVVFSEDGDKFYLILNGEKQNDEPVANIRVEELPQPYYSAKIIFEDKTIPEISKKNLMITDADGKFMEVTYKIRRDKFKKAKLNYYSMIAVQPDFVPPSGMYVHQFGQPAGNPRGNMNGNGMNMNNGGGNNNGNNGGFGASVSVPGMNMNISISDPDGDVRTGSHHQQTTTTTHQSSGGYNHQNNNNTQQAPVRGCMNNWPMNASDFSAAKKTINESSFDETKLSTAKTIVASNCLNTDQIVQICNLFSFEDNKLDFAKFAFKYCTEPKNYFKVNNVFSFSSSKEDLNSFIQGGGY